MYPSANIVVFVNLEDIFAQVEQVLENHPLYLCVSYDTDLLAMEQIIGYAGEWCDFASKHENLKLKYGQNVQTNHSFAAFFHFLP